jgi:hypothetical protein
VPKRLIARLARHGGDKLLDQAVDKLFPDAPAAEGGKAARRTLTRTIAGAALIRVATRSVPGAIIVGGGILAKTLYDRRRARKAPAGKGTNGQS